MAYAGTTSAGSTAARVRLATGAITRALLRASPRVMALATALLFCGTLALLLVRHSWDASSFIVCGDVFCHPSRVPHAVSVYPMSGGYDGQFYFRLALNPFTSTSYDFGIALDVPSYRQQRILYPLLVWLLSLGGRPEFAVWAMLVVNVGAIVWLAYLCARYARSCARPAALGLVLALFPGFLTTLGRDMAELVEVALLLAGLVSHLERRAYRAGAFLALAVLARETALLLVGAIGLVELLRFRATRDRAALRRALHALVPPICVFVVWQVLLTASWGTVPILHGGYNNLGTPFAGLLSATRIMAGSSRWQDYVTAAILATALISAVAMAFLSPRTRIPAVRCALVGYALLTVCMTEVVLGEQWSVIRTQAELATLAWMTVVTSSSRIALVTFASIMPVAWLCMLNQLL